MKSDFKDFLLVYTTPIILIILAFLQIYRANQQRLTAWKGGGFGMFSTIDSSGTRFLRIYLVTDKNIFPIEVPISKPHLQRLSKKAKTIPTKKN